MENNKKEIEKKNRLFDYLLSIGFDKLFIVDINIHPQHLIIFRHIEFYREQILVFPNYDELQYYNYEIAMKFLDDWGYLDDNELKIFKKLFL